MKYLFLDLWEWVKYQKSAWSNMSDERLGEIVSGWFRLIVALLLIVMFVSFVLGALSWLVN